MKKVCLSLLLLSSFAAAQAGFLSNMYNKFFGKTWKKIAWVGGAVGTGLFVELYRRAAKTIEIEHVIEELPRVLDEFNKSGIQNLGLDQERGILSFYSPVTTSLVGGEYVFIELSISEIIEQAVQLRAKDSSLTYSLAITNAMNKMILDQKSGKEVVMLEQPSEFKVEDPALIVEMENLLPSVIEGIMKDLGGTMMKGYDAYFGECFQCEIPQDQLEKSIMVILPLQTVISDASMKKIEDKKLSCIGALKDAVVDFIKAQINPNFEDTSSDEGQEVSDEGQEISDEGQVQDELIEQVNALLPSVMEAICEDRGIAEPEVIEHESLGQTLVLYVPSDDSGKAEVIPVFLTVETIVLGAAIMVLEDSMEPAEAIKKCVNELIVAQLNSSLDD